VLRRQTAGQRPLRPGFRVVGARFALKTARARRCSASASSPRPRLPRTSARDLRLPRHARVILAPARPVDLQRAPHQGKRLRGLAFPVQGLASRRRAEATSG
jgi:hypothetical protein